VAERWSVLEWIDVFKVDADTKDVKRTGCPTADWLNKGEETVWELVHVNRQLIVQGTFGDINLY
jgi:hypothetical protein